MSKKGVPKVRILHPRLAAVLASLRHGEMVCVSDAGSGSSDKALIPLDASVEYIDLGVATGVPSFQDVVGALCQVGDFEAALVADNMRKANPAAHAFLVNTFGQDLVHDLPYFPDFYQVRNRVKVMVQTGDYGLAASVFLVHGYPSPNIPLDWLKSSEWYENLKKSGDQMVSDGKTWVKKIPAENADKGKPED